MPLRNHFRPPTSKAASWEAVHGGWPMVIVLALAGKLPQRYVAHPRVHLGAFAEIDVSTYEKDAPTAPGPDTGNGGIATAVWAPARPTLTVVSDLPAQDEYEVRVYDTERNQRLVAAIELVSPANKDRPGSRRTLAAKCAGYLKQAISVAIVDVVTERTANLHADLVEVLEVSTAVWESPTQLYAIAYRPVPVQNQARIEAWPHKLTLGQSLPVLPLWLSPELCLPLPLEETYNTTCIGLRIQVP